MNRYKVPITIPVLTLVLGGFALGQPAVQGPRVRATLHSSVQAVVPGQPFDLALKLDVDPDWHIYWKNPGDSGLPPQVRWELPEGFQAGPLRFPVPKRYVDRAKTTTFILRGSPTLITQVTPPQVVSDGKVAIVAHVNWYVCKDICLREEKSLRLELPVAAAGTPAQPANQDLFKRAERAMPKLRASHNIKLGASVDGFTPKPGAKFDFLLSVDIPKGLHIQSNEPLLDFLIAADIILERTEGVDFAKPIYPKPKIREQKLLGGKLSEFEGKITIRIPAAIGEKAPPLPARLGGVFTYQACTDAGQCYPPETVAFATTVADTRGAAATPVDEEGTAAIARSEPGATGSLPARAKQTTDTPPREAETVTAPGATGSLPARAEQTTEKPPPGGRPTRGSDATGRPTPGADGTGHPTPGSDATGLEDFLRRLGVPGLLIGCFLYGLILNATPCVFPILSIKVMGFVQQAHQSRRRTAMLGLTFGVGVVLFFVILGFLAAQGKNVLQYPVAVIALGAVVMVLALSMLDVYTLQVPTAATKLEASIQKEGLLSSFGKGALAPVLGFACTGPFLAGAFGWATTQEPRIAFFAFLFAGLGMAFPYVLLGAKPNWLSFLPKPGNWMIAFERIMGFMLLGMVIYLLHPLIYQIGSVGFEWTLGFLVAVAMGCWVLGQVDLSMSTTRRWKYRAGAAVIPLMAGVLVFGVFCPLGEAKVKALAQRQTAGPSADDWSMGIPWRTWSADAVEREVRAGKTVFVDFTAAYCLNCKVNKKRAINTVEVRSKHGKLAVVAFQGDFTTGDERIFAMLQRHNRAGVPLNLIYPACRPDEPIVLPVLFSKSKLLSALDQAGSSKSEGCGKSIAMNAG